jgi:hypothetical protein
LERILDFRQVAEALAEDRTKLFFERNSKVSQSGQKCTYVVGAGDPPITGKVCFSQGRAATEAGLSLW